jgi:DNA-binding CsgD family transcriptional regulator
MRKIKPWTNREFARLAEMLRERKSVKDIAAALERSAKSVYNAMARDPKIRSVTDQKRAVIWDRSRQEWTAEP